MEEYLLQHNVTMTDFWILALLWCLGLALLIYLWIKTVEIYKEEKRKQQFHNGIMWIASASLTYLILPLLVMGALNFVRMMTGLNPYKEIMSLMFDICICGSLSLCLFAAIFALVVMWKDISTRK